MLVKYNSSGTLIWEETYNGDDNGDDEAASLELDDAGYLYVAGSSFIISSLDYLTLKFNASGVLVWDITFNSSHNKNDRATNMAIDEDGDIIVSGQCEKNDSVMTYFTVKYVEYSLDESILEHIGDRNQGFMKQMGQLIRTDSVIADEVKYYSDRLKHQLYAQDDRLSFVVMSTDSTLNFLNTDSLVLEDIDVQRIDLEFFNCDTTCKARAFKPLDYYSNYYLPHCSPGVVRIPYFESLYYKSVWPGIDLYLSASNIEEYTFRLDVGAKPEDIKFNAVGADSVTLIDAGVKFALSSEISSIEIGGFKTYQADLYGDLQELLWQPKFEVNGSIISFYDFGSYNQNIPLVISNVKTASNLMFGDLCWSTFFGGSGGQISLASAVKDDEFALAGWSTSVSNFPEDIGTYIGGTLPHGVVAKFDQEGVLKWSILYGGDTHTFFSAVAFDNNGHVLVTGYSTATNLTLEPTDNEDTYFENLTGVSNSAVIAEFPNTGDDLIWATYFGGSASDKAFTIEVNYNNDRYIAGFGNNANGSIGDPDFPLYEGDYGAYYHENLGGQSGFIARFNGSNELLWSTFVEGSYAIADLLLKQNYNFAILGETSSNSLPVINGGNEYSLFKTSISGQRDMLYGIMNEGGQFEHLTYIGGGGLDGVYFSNNIYSNSNKLAEDSQRNTYLIGYASDGIELQPQGVYYFSEDYTQQDMPFVYKIDDLTYELKYGSYLYELSPACSSKVSSISIDGADNMIISSQVRNATGNCDDAWPLNGAYIEDEIYDNSKTGHLLIQNEFQGAVYATYLGGSKRDYISNSFMLNENLFLVGYTQSDNTNVQFPLWDPETDAYFQGNIPGSMDMFLTKICQDVITDVNESSLPIVKEEFPFAVFPNPALSEFTVLSISADVTLSEIELLDIRGKVIRNYDLPNNLIRQKIPISDLSMGLYVVRIRTNDNLYYNHKLVIK